MNKCHSKYGGGPILGRIKKELRLLWVAWAITGVAAVFTCQKVLFSTGNAFGILGYEFAPAVFALSFAILCALSFGTEFQARTLLLLLSQPVSRARLWTEKLLTLAFCTAVVLAVFGVALFWAMILSPNPSLLRAIEPSTVILPITVAVALLCSSAFWTLSAGSTVGGVVFSVSGLGALAIATHLLEIGISRLTHGDLERLQLEPLLGPVTLGDTFFGLVTLAYSALFLWLGWRKFAHFELRQAVGSEGVSLFQGRFLARRTPAPLRFAARGAVPNLLRKELRLQKPVFALGALFIVFWVVMVGLSVSGLVKPQIARSMVYAAMTLYVPLLLTLAGCVSLGDEKALGTHAWHLTLPAPITVQWLIKSLASLATGIVLGIIMPFVCGWLVTFHLGSGVHAALLDHQSLVLMLCICALVLSTSFWAAALCSSTVRAVVVCFAAIATFYGIILFASWLTQGSGGLQTPLLLALLNRRPGFLSVSVGHLSGILVVACAALVICVLVQTRLLFRRIQHSSRAVWLHSAILGLAVFCVSFWALDLKRSVDEASQTAGSYLNNLSQALSALSPALLDQAGSRAIPMSELAKTGILSLETQKWLDSSTIYIRKVVQATPKSPGYEAEIQFPSHWILRISFQPGFIFQGP